MIKLTDNDSKVLIVFDDEGGMTYPNKLKEKSEETENKEAQEKPAKDEK